MTTKFNPDCVRRIANWTSVKSTHKFDKKTFDANQTLGDIATYSPKIAKLIENIKLLDEKDMRDQGKMFKHFIFSDVKSQGAGSKIVASALIAHGFNLIYDERHSIQSNDVLMQTKNRNFALLTGTPVFNKPLSVKTKKSVLTLYNSRPDNIHGELCRFIVLSGEFKEGIDLFDCKYVHIVEPQTSKADLRQAIGRGTRYCGNRGLEFHPSQGWPLQVMLYDVEIPQNLEEELQSKTLYELFLKNSNIDLRKIAFTDELESVSIQGSVDYLLNKAVHRFALEPDDYRLNVMFKTPTSGGARRFSEEVKCQSNCKSRASKDVPVGTPLLLAAFLGLGYDLPNLRKSLPREYLCLKLKTDERYCSEVQKAWRNPVEYVKEIAPQLADAFQKNKQYNLKTSHRNSLMKFCYYLVPSLKNVPKKTKTVKPSSPNAQTIDTAASLKEKMMSPNAAPINSVSNSSTKLSPNAAPINSVSINSAKLSQNPDEDQSKDEEVEDATSVEPLKKEAGFLDVRKYVTEHYTHFTWPEVKLENLCIPSSGGGESTIVKFTQTQDFIRNFFQPSSPQKGMLLWHSVGSGKTCAAIATASSTFEKEGYTILWVTRSSLKSDIWKNMFEMVCSDQLQDRMKKGFKIPSDPTARLKLLSKAWAIRPISYKQFSNLVEGKNKFYEELVKKNGSSDPLKKTLVIIDEAHKLYGGADLSSKERPNMKKFHAAVMNSYLKSGDNSVRLLMMTGTPITNDPIELIKLLNLVREESKQLPTSFDDFATQYLDSNGKFTKKGKWAYLNDIAGYISYLNRERDARQFSQPVIIPVRVKMSDDNQDNNGVNSNSKEVLADKMVQKKSIDDQIKMVKMENKLKKNEIKERCKGLRSIELQNCKSEADILVQDIEREMEKEIISKLENKENLIEEIKNIKKILSSNKDSGSQLSYLFDKCKKGTTTKKAKKVKHDNFLE